MSEEELVDKYFKENMCVSFDKFMENWKEQQELSKFLQQQNQKLKDELKAVNKGLRKVLEKRKKWKNKYYKEKREKRMLIKYLEDNIKKCDYSIKLFKEKDYNSIFLGLEIEHLDDFKIIFQDILERVKSGKYE